MRHLLCLLLLLSPVLAGDPDPVEDFTKNFERLMADVKSNDPAARQKAVAELEKRLEKLTHALQRSWPRTTPLRLFIGTSFGSEAMTGSFEDAGRKGTYRLKSIDGKGRYTLAWTLVGKDGSSTKATADGTLKELRDKHPFLRATMAFSLPEALVFTGRIHPPTPLVGVVVQPPTPELRHHLALPEGAGLVVNQVLPDSRAMKLGIKKHDVLLRINGELIDTRAQIKRLNEPRGELEIIRRAKIVTIPLKGK